MKLLSLFFAVFRYWKRYEHQLPDVVAEVRQSNSKSSRPDLVDRFIGFKFNLPDESSRSKWLIDAVRIAKSRRKWLAEAGTLHKPGTYIGHELGSEWQKQIKYDPPADGKKIVLLHPDAPTDLIFSVRVCLRNRLSVKCWVDVIPS